MENIDKLATVSKSLFDHRVIDQRQEIESLKKRLQNIESEHVIHMYESDGSYYFRLPSDFIRFINRRKYSGIRFYFDCHQEEFYRKMWFGNMKNFNSDELYPWKFPSVEFRDKCIKALKEALDDWNKNIHKPKKDFGKLTIIR